MKPIESKQEVFASYPQGCFALMNALLEANQNYFKSRMEAYQDYIGSVSQVKDFSELSKKNQNYMKTLGDDLSNLYKNRFKSWQEFFNAAFSNNGMLRLIDARQDLISPLLESFGKFSYPLK